MKDYVTLSDEKAFKNTHYESDILKFGELKRNKKDYESFSMSCVEEEDKDQQ